jgi:hypothetical protein
MFVAAMTMVSHVHPNALPPNHLDMCSLLGLSMTAPPKHPFIDRRKSLLPRESYETSMSPPPFHPCTSQICSTHSNAIVLSNDEV